MRNLQSLFQPDDAPTFTLDSERLARWVGWVAVGLPAIMLWATWVGWPFARTCFYDSVSHFYYAPFFGAFLVAALAFIGVFLWAYTGEGKWENRLASMAGFCAFGVALFPTSGDGCDLTTFTSRSFGVFTRAAESYAVESAPFFALFPKVDWVHFGSAALLFAFLAFYSFVVFPRVIKSRHIGADNKLIRVKRQRNLIYYYTGTVIVICMVAMAAKPWIMPPAEWNAMNLTFVFEAVALVHFGIAWMVKGRVLAIFRDP